MRIVHYEYSSSGARVGEPISLLWAVRCESSAKTVTLLRIHGFMYDEHMEKQHFPPKLFSNETLPLEQEVTLEYSMPIDPNMDVESPHIVVMLELNSPDGPQDQVLFNSTLTFDAV